MEQKLRIALLGGGPSALFMFKKLLESGQTDIAVTIFEKGKQLGSGMPYSKIGANPEHITNVSGNEIPELITSVEQWIETAPKNVLDQFDITLQKYNDYKVLPRLLFGHYLTEQFRLLCERADRAGLEYLISYESEVTDIVDKPDRSTTIVEINNGEQIPFDKVVVCIGHTWAKKHEGKISGYFDSPYPPSKLAMKLDHPVAIRGASLTAIDAVRTFARSNGKFIESADGKLSYQIDPDSANFKMVMHARSGLLPAVRFHLKDPHLSADDTLTKEDMQNYSSEHGGLLSLDHLFEENFKAGIRKNDPEFYERIRGMNMEEFVTEMMEVREQVDPFNLFEAEYMEAEKSIQRRESVYWKEMLAILSYSLNYPAKYLPAEDMQRLKKTLMPLISIVIAFVPQSSCEQLLALHKAGLLEMVSVGDDSFVEPNEAGGALYHYTDDDGKQQIKHYQTYVDCVGQPHMSYTDVPFKGLLDGRSISPARVRFKSNSIGKEQQDGGNEDVQQGSDGNYYLNVPGIAINDNFQVLDSYGAYNPRIYMMAVPYIGGFNPDYSGLDFCDTASDAIIKTILNDD
ncbi:FAD/NAD(P)-binding protein [Mucilaginibacter myungsuensis]|uniref:FAD/NAD(P)-binding protein n=1 Tax=Mucilaginibacter myungsuensis TaxID=649104 RepID=A0A929KXN5_9SPHI|nr:FAD/NAD(P)-binding protein [Mucilaginibacter myungsuensis]